jgi:hypothetical protein
MAYRKYSARNFLDKETELMSLLACDIDPPNHFDFTLLYFKFIRMKIHGFLGGISRSCISFIEQYETIATDFCRLVLSDVDAIAMRPSILGATAIHFGLEVVQNHLPKIIHDPGYFNLKDFQLEVEYVKMSWREIVIFLLSELPDYSEI